MLGIDVRRAVMMPLVNGPFGVTMRVDAQRGEAQSEKFCRFFNTSVRRRRTCDSNFEGTP